MNKTEIIVNVVFLLDFLVNYFQLIFKLQNENGILNVQTKLVSGEAQCQILFFYELYLNARVTQGDIREMNFR